MTAAGAGVVGLAVGGVAGYAMGQAAAPTAPAVTEPTVREKAKVAMILIGTIDDLGWNGQHYQGLEYLKNLGHETHYTELVGPPEVEKVARDYIALDYNLIIYTGGWAREGFQAASQAFPDVGHVLVEGFEEDKGPNSEIVIDMSQELGYVEGLMAGQLTKAKTVGWILGIEVPDMLLWAAGGYQGLHDVDPNIRRLFTIIGDPEDPARGKEATLGMIEAGADVIVECGDGTSFGIVEAVKAHNLPLLSYWGGSSKFEDSKAGKLGPDFIVAEGYCNWGPAYANCAKWYEEGRFGYRGQYPDFENGLLQLILNPKFEPQFGAMCDDVINKIKMGEIGIRRSAPKA